MKERTFLEAAEMAAGYMYHYAYDQGQPVDDCLDAAGDIYYALTGERLDVEEYFGIEYGSEGEDY